MKPIYLLLTFLCTSLSYGQNSMSDKFNKISQEELNMTVYEKDTTAHAVVLEEYGENYFDVINDRIRLIKHFYARIKILDKQGLEEANIKIPIYKNDKSSEYIKNVKAITHNPSKIDHLAKDQIFLVDVNGYYSEKRFTFPNAKVGSVIEYQYTLESPFIYNFEGWDFQSNIPKMYSEFNAKIPANYRYNRTLKGFQKLAVNEASVEKRCFKIQGFVDKADCEVLKYAMKDIPAFKEESYMLSRNNYLSKISFELSEFKRFDGGTDTYTKSWKAVDKDMRRDKDIGMQVRKNNYFKNQLSDAILKESSKLKKAKKIYAFIKEHYNWNGKYGLFGDASVRRAFQEKSGNVAEINLSLINSLLAADIKTETIMLSSRAKGLPTQKHPVMSDFNYLIAKVTIGGETFLLDATDKSLSFGLLPIRALNYNGRAMDFKKPSYWYTISPFAENRQNTVVSIAVSDDGSAKGKISQVNTGYLAYEKRNELAEQSTESYLDELETQLSFIEIEEYKAEERSNVEKPIKEIFSFEFDEDGFSNSETFLDPFFMKIFSKNPFKLEERQYPVDFAYSRIYTTRFLMSLPDNYEFTSVPEDQRFSIAGDKAICGLNVVQQNGQLNMSFKLIINNFHFTAEEYQELKAFFSKLSILQKNTRLAIKKK
ncbi:DUF3857 and transglutaminase domain-containing protein [Kordia sp. YSTF-M3]|uniref:DUF3857 and transglutaminase domain-containing protein n=1 Tax=Kordia aestuariivivens TaxID=2759037 RepID=A0ABR7QCT4_9FLAO|nr:DUF3857 domain-containing protein [Kordia aestuariivivens]MBC8756186.1 DUF3857 and transglutaminase domain-containing protein [Kordia aestuariivivens]